jgi:hypothetical protein
MKNLIWIFALTFLAAACSKEEATEAPTADLAVEEQAIDAAVEAAENATAETETLEVVEESAAEAEPENQAIMLAQADDVAPRSWTYKEGQHFTRMTPTQPTVGGADKIEVAEVFMYSCPHCFDLEGYINTWEETKKTQVFAWSEFLRCSISSRSCMRSFTTQKSSWRGAVNSQIMSLFAIWSSRNFTAVVIV